MAIFNDMIITNKGQKLCAKIIAGKELYFTKVMVGSGNLGTKDPEKLLDIIDPKYDLKIQAVTVNGQQKNATIYAAISNEHITQPVYICELGLFAEDPDEGEILYGYTTAGKYGDYYAPLTSGPFTWNYQIDASIGNNTNVTAQISSLVYDHFVMNTNTSLNIINGSNQNELNKSIDTKLQKNTNDISSINTEVSKINQNVENKLTEINNTVDNKLSVFNQSIDNKLTVNNQNVTNQINNITTKVDSMTYERATGTATALTVTLPATLQNGYWKKIIANADNGGAATTINGKSLYKVGTKTPPNLKKDRPYEVYFNSTSNCFFLKASATGTATSAQVLAGVPFSNENDVDLIGTMPERGAPVNNIDCGGVINLQEGHYTGGKITANSLASQTSATADASKIVSGYSAWVNGVKINGNATIQSLGGVSNGFKTITSDILDRGTTFTYKYEGSGGWVKSYFTIDIPGNTKILSVYARSTSSTTTNNFDRTYSVFMPAFTQHSDSVIQYTLPRRTGDSLITTQILAGWNVNIPAKIQYVAICWND